MFMVAIQVIVFFVITYRFNVSELANNSYALLDYAVSMKLSFFQRDLNSLISNVKLYHKTVSENINEIAGERDLSLYDGNYEGELYSILEDNLTDIIDLSRSSVVTGGYIILENGENRKPSIYVRSISPQVVTLDNSDLLAEAGTAQLLKDKGISLDTNWSPKLEIDESKAYDFYNVPFKAGNDYKNIDAVELGYWSDVHNFNGIDVISYSIPLVDKEHNSYGVLGIEISLDYISKILAESELEFGNNGSYMIVKSKNGDENFTEEFIGKTIWNELFASGKNFKIKKQNEEYNVYCIYGDELNNNVYCILKQLEMYKSNTPFEGDLWYLAVAAEEKGLFEGIYKLNDLFFKAIIIIVLISFIITVFVSFHFTKPIENLVDELRKSDPSKQLSLKKINIGEIDELSTVIERLNKDVAYSASRLTQMIDLVNISIGAIEYDKGSDKCYLSGDAIKMMDFSEEYKSKNNHQKEDYDREFEAFKQKVVSIIYSKKEEIYTCEVLKNNGEIVWLRFSIKESGLRTIVVFIDVTEEIVNMKQAEYERDHDNLTGLLNRSAFERRCSQVIASEPKILGVAMWDLDNLKYINDNYGHEFGDLYIISTANVFKELEKLGAFAARRSGDEFFALIYGFDSKEEIYNAVKNIHEKLSSTKFTLSENKTVNIKASGGIVFYPEEAQTVSDLIKYVDFAMYYAKQNDKGSLKMFDMEQYRKSELFIENN